MKCLDLRQLIASRRSLLAYTRGERAAIVAHLHVCEPCLEWYRLVGPHEVNPIEAQQIIITTHEDMEDPEYAEMVAEATRKGIEQRKQREES